VLYGTSSAVTRQLQMVLNATARMVVGIGKYEHITPMLRDTLHWLPVMARIQFKIAVLTFDCVRGTGPVYLKQVICPSRTCHVDHSVRLAAATCSFRGLTRPVASEVSPVVWNVLPPDLRSPHNSRKQFRSKLKAFLFRQVYTA